MFYFQKSLEHKNEEKRLKKGAMSVEKEEEEMRRFLCAERFRINKKSLEEIRRIKKKIEEKWYGRTF